MQSRVGERGISHLLHGDVALVGAIVRLKHALQQHEGRPALAFGCEHLGASLDELHLGDRPVTTRDANDGIVKFFVLQDIEREGESWGACAGRERGWVTVSVVEGQGGGWRR